MPFDICESYDDKIQILNHAREILMDGWCQGAYYRLNSHCLLGAIVESSKLYRATYHYQPPENQRSNMRPSPRLETIIHNVIADCLYPMLPNQYKFNVASVDDKRRCVLLFNDDYSTNKDDVIDLLDRAISAEFGATYDRANDYPKDYGNYDGIP